MASAFPFLLLPPEIRLMIYRILLLGKASGHIVSVTKDMCVPAGSGSQVQEHCPAEPLQLSSQLLRVCRLISQEAIVVLYSENVFQATEPSFLYRFFLPTIGVHNVALLKSIKVDMVIHVVKDPKPASDIGPGTAFSCLAVKDVSLMFRWYLGLRSIQEFSLSFSTPDRLPAYHRSCGSCGNKLLSALKRRGFRETHTLHEHVEIISATMRITTIQMVKLSAEVRGR
jgi:hypothetical protein